MPAILSDADITAQRLLLPAPWSQTVISHPTGASDPSVDKGLLSTETSLQSLEEGTDASDVQTLKESYKKEKIK